MKKKKKGEKKLQKQKNILKKITESSPSLCCLTDLFVDREHKKEAKNCLALATENFSK